MLGNMPTAFLTSVSLPRLYASPSFSLSPRCNLSTPASKEPAPSIDTDFAAWASSKNIDTSSVALTLTSAELPIPLRGLTATKPLRFRESMMSVPDSACFQVTSLDRRRSPFQEKISSQTWRRLPWFARLALRILEARNGEFKDWVNRLPREFDTLIHWNMKELKELQSPRMINEVTKQKATYREYWDILNGDPGNGMLRDLTYDEFVWAVECVRSRAFSGPLELASFKERSRLFAFIAVNTFLWPTVGVLNWENALNGGLTAMFALALYDVITPRILKFVQGVELRRFAMAPGIDFFNHSSRVNGKAEVSYEYFREKFVVQAGEDYNVGDQIFISYGKVSNDSFLQYYGFVEKDNPVDTYVFLPEIEKTIRAPEGTLVARMPQGFDEKTIGIIARSFGNNKEKAKQVLHELCKIELAGKETSLEEDRRLLDEDTCKENARLRLAIQYRIAKKEVLTKALECTEQK